MYYFFTLFLLFTSCTQKKTKIINSILESEVITIDPQKSYDMVSNTVVYQFYEALYQYHYLKRPYTIEPLLAEKLPEVSDNGLTYTITIKKNILFHNWEKISDKKLYVTSYDFITGIKRLAFDPTESKGWWLLQGKIQGLDKFKSEVKNSLDKFEKTNVTGLVALSDHKFQIKLTKPYPEFIHILAMVFTSPIPIQSIKKFQNNLEEIEFGTGAYALEQIEHNKFVKMKRSPQYTHNLYPSNGDREAHDKGLFKNANKKLPLNDGLFFKVVKGDKEIWNTFLKKEVDFIDIPPDTMDLAINLNGKIKKKFKEQKIEIAVSPSLVFWWLGINMSDPLLGKNKDLRKAIAYGINMKSYVNNFYSHLGTLANSIYPPGVRGYNTIKKWPYDYNISKAKQYLEKAGYPNGKGLPIIEFQTRRESERHLLMAKFIQKELSKIGITIKIKVNTFSSFLSKAKQGKMQFWSSGWLLDYPAPQNMLQLLYSKNGNGGPNKTNFSNPEFDKLYLEYQKLTDSIQKDEYLSRLESIVIEEVPWLITNYSINYVAKHDNLKNLRYSDLIFNMYKYLEKK